MKAHILVEAGLQTLIVTPKKDDAVGELIDFFRNPNPPTVEWKQSPTQPEGELRVEKRWL